MRFREAKHNELGQLALIGTRAFHRDNIYAHFYPHRLDYPRDYYDGILTTLVKAFVTPGCKILVAELEDGDAMPKPDSMISSVVIGYATVILHGTDEQKAQFTPASQDKSLYRNLFAMAQEQQSNRAIDQDAIQQFYEQEQRILGPLENIVDYPTLAILPEFQGLGYGKQFVKMLIAIPDEYGMGAVCDASTAGLGIYLRVGFRVVGHAKLPTRTVTTKDGGSIELPAIEIPVLRRELGAKSLL